jgi:hypothetical protein
MRDPRTLGYLVEALTIGAERAEGFRLRDLACSPAAWQLIDGAVNTFGWVCVLRDGRRGYIEYRVDEDRGAYPQNVVVRTLRPDEVLPALDDPAVVWFEPRHVNLWLATCLALTDDADILEHLPELERKSRGARG